MQPLWTRKYQTTSKDKKNHAISRDKKSCNLVGQKSHATSQDKKNYAISWDQKITQPLGTKKKYATYRDKKKPATSQDKKNHTTSHDKKSHETSRDQKNHATTLKFLSGHFEFETFYLSLVLSFIVHEQMFSVLGFLPLYISMCVCKDPAAVAGLWRVRFFRLENLLLAGV